MPYIVTTHARTGPSCSPEGCACEWEDSSRAVATLEEVRVEAYGVLRAHYGARKLGTTGRQLHINVDDLPESGGTVGPLPDGRTIHTELTTRERLGRDLGWREGEIAASTDHLVCVAWNAVFGAREASGDA